MQCNSNSDPREDMFNAILKMPNGIGIGIIERSDVILATLLGKICIDVSMCDMVESYKVVCKWVNRMYWRAISERAGVG